MAQECNCSAERQRRGIFRSASEEVAVVETNDSTSPDGPGLGAGSVPSGPTGRSDWTGPQTGSLGLDGLGLDQSKQDNIYQFQSRTEKLKK